MLSEVRNRRLNTEYSIDSAAALGVRAQRGSQPVRHRTDGLGDLRQRWASVLGEDRNAPEGYWTYEGKPQRWASALSEDRNPDAPEIAQALVSSAGRSRSARIATHS